MDLPIRLKGNLKRISDYSLSPLGAQYRDFGAALQTLLTGVKLRLLRRLGNPRQSWILESTPWNTGFQSVELRFWIPIVSEISDFSSGIPDSKAQDSGFHKQIFPGVRIPQAKISRISESGLPYMERPGNVVRRLYYCAYMSRFAQTYIWF